jgi:Rieske Fe-S protein
MAEPTQVPQDSPATDTGRRRFCQVTIGGMAVASVATVGYPVVTFLKLPKSMTQSEAMEVQLSSLPEGAATWGESGGRQIVVIKTGGTVRAFSGSCPHLGCIVQWEGATRTFKCPCHGAEFNDQGLPIGGPVNVPLEPVNYEISGDVLRIT